MLQSFNEMGKVLPYGHTADAELSGNIVIALSFQKTHVEDILLLPGEATMGDDLQTA